jgi:hypothetical protein
VTSIGTTCWSRCIGLRVAAAVLVLSILTACDGYPTEDEPLLDPFLLTAEERVILLNRIGEGADPDGRWRYNAPSTCLLEVQRGSGWWFGDGFLVELKGAVLAVVKGNESENAAFRLMASAQGQSRVILQSRKLLEAQRAEQLVTLLIRDCRSPSKPAL